MMNFGYGFCPSGFGGFGTIFMILWWAFIVIGIIALLRWMTDQRATTASSRTSVLDIINERYARGEINKAEYEEKKKDLS